MNQAKLRHHTAHLIRAQRAFALVIAAAAILGIGQARAERVTFEFAPTTLAAVEKLINDEAWARGVYLVADV